MQPARTPWGNFPDVVLHAAEADVKAYPAYRAAKSGDADAAEELVSVMFRPAAAAELRILTADRAPIIVAVHAYEVRGVNAIPEALADRLAQEIGFDVDTSIVQANVVAHTGASGFTRLANQASFEGAVKPGADYLLVDDFVGQGGTLANLKGHIEFCGGHVVAATVLTGKPYSARLTPSPEQLAALRAKHGEALENWWQARFGHAFDRLTQSEARYLERTENAQSVRDKVAAAEQIRDSPAA